ncbi:MAG: HupE/UreJ family protein [Burkholderiaceae bacterium]
MKSLRTLAVLAVLGCLVSPISAHRLDEYLQAATFKIENGQIALRLRLTAGVSVASQVIAEIDTNGDGRISDAEGAAYAAKVSNDVSLTLDGHAVPLQLQSMSYPPIQDITQGLGEIVLDFQAVSTSGSGTHELTFTQRHRNPTAVHLVNSLVPSAPGIRVLDQQRDYDQSHYRMTFSVDMAKGSSATRDTDALSILETFFYHGVRHILTGFDHLLFACALVLAATSLWELFKVVTAFTLAHSITLTLASLGIVHLPSPIVEPLISASIVFVALQNVFWPQVTHGNSRLFVAFFFGLFHGLAFAGGLLDLMSHMPKETVLLALLGFSVGVEAGHQIVLLPLFGALKRVRDRKTPAARNALQQMTRIGSALIAVAGLYYFIVAVMELD